MDKLKKLEIQRLLKEYDLLVLGDEYKQEIVDNYTTEFMKDILGEGPNEKKALNKIKECALLSCSVNYTPQGSYMTFDDGSMVSYVIDLKFTEIVPLYDTDYEDDHPIGF